jgi:hypothetical protein
MTYSWPVYIVLAIVAAVSFGAALFLPTADILRWVSGVPALVALIGIVLQIFRDHEQHKKALAIQRDQQHFILGVTSHMANVAFDKHVEFCEGYISKMQETLSMLFREGPTRKCIELSSNLAGIRLSFRTWLTSDIQDKILPFEDALTKIASKHIELEGLGVGNKRNQVVEEMHDTFADVLGLSRLEGRGNNDEEIAARRIMDHLQAILGVKQLVQLRITLVDEAVKTLERKD